MARKAQDDAPKLVSIYLIAGAQGTRNGEAAEVDQDTADRLIRQGHAITQEDAELRGS